MSSIMQNDCSNNTKAKLGTSDSKFKKKNMLQNIISKLYKPESIFSESTNVFPDSVIQKIAFLIAYHEIAPEKKCFLYFQEKSYNSQFISKIVREKDIAFMLWEIMNVTEMCPKLSNPLVERYGTQENLRDLIMNGAVVDDQDFFFDQFVVLPDHHQEHFNGVFCRKAKHLNELIAQRQSTQHQMFAKASADIETNYDNTFQMNAEDTTIRQFSDDQNLFTCKQDFNLGDDCFTQLAYDVVEEEESNAPSQIDCFEAAKTQKIFTIIKDEDREREYNALQAASNNSKIFQVVTEKQLTLQNAPSEHYSHESTEDNSDKNTFLSEEHCSSHAVDEFQFTEEDMHQFQQEQQLLQNEFNDQQQELQIGQENGQISEDLQALLSTPMPDLDSLQEGIQYCESHAMNMHIQQDVQNTFEETYYQQPQQQYMEDKMAYIQQPAQYQQEFYPSQKQIQFTPNNANISAEISEFAGFDRQAGFECQENGNGFQELNLNPNVYF